MLDCVYMKKIQDAAAVVFILSVFVLTAVSILGVWQFFARDVIVKSFETLGILALVSVVIIGASRFLDSSQSGSVYVADPGFKLLRHVSLGILIAAASVLALVGILAIWEVIAQSEVLYKSLSSLGIVAFSTFVVVAVCMERERHPLLAQRGGGFSVGSIILLLLGAWVVLNLIG